MTRQQADIRETARKLRRLTTSPNEHEAARAREKYQAFTAQHQISLEDEPVFPSPVEEAIRRYQEYHDAVVQPLLDQLGRLRPYAEQLDEQRREREQRWRRLFREEVRRREALLARRKKTTTTKAAAGGVPDANEKGGTR